MLEKEPVFLKPLEIIHNWELSVELAQTIQLIQRSTKEDGNKKIMTLAKATEYLVREVTRLHDIDSDNCEPFCIEFSSKVSIGCFGYYPSEQNAFYDLPDEHGKEVKEDRKNVLEYIEMASGDHPNHHFRNRQTDCVYAHYKDWCLNEKKVYPLSQRQFEEILKEESNLITIYEEKNQWLTFLDAVTRVNL